MSYQSEKDRLWRGRRAAAWAGPWRVLIGAGVMTLTARRSDSRQLFGGSGLDALNRVARALPWERLGGRAVLVTLTYPDPWQPWVADAPKLAEQRTEFLRRWKRQWGEAAYGLWVLEFQNRGAPHLHLYVRLPERVSESDVEVLRKHTIANNFGGRGPNGERLGWRAVTGEFGYWARHAWVDTVGTRGTVAERKHSVAGVDVAAFYWSERAWQMADGLRVLEYLSDEIGKARQKVAPRGFGNAQMWRSMGGFKPVVLVDEPVEPAVALDLYDRMEAKQRRRYGDESRLGRRWREGAGKCVLQEWYESVAMVEEAEASVIGARAAHEKGLARVASVHAKQGEFLAERA